MPDRITYGDKENGDAFTADDADNIRLAVNALGTAADRDAGSAPGQVALIQSNGLLPSTIIPGGSGGGGGGGGTGDVVGPIASTDGVPALFDGESGKTIKAGTAAQLVPSGIAPGKVLGESGGVPAWVDTGTGLGDVTGPASSTTGRAVVFADETGKALGEASGPPVMGPGTVVAGHAVTFADTSGNALATAGAAPVLNTVADVRNAIAASAADATQGPLLGGDIKAALVSMSQTSLLDVLNDIYAKAEIVGFHLGYEGGVMPEFDVGDLLTVGPVIGGSSNVFGISTVPSVTIDQTITSFAVTDATGLVEYAPYNDGTAWGLMQSGRPYDTRTVDLVSNQLSFDARLGRKIFTGPLTGNSTISAGCWDYILDHEEPVELYVRVGATSYTITPVAGTAGYLQGNIPTLDTNSIHQFEMSRINGIPSIRWVDSYDEIGVPQPVPVFVGQRNDTTLSGTAAWTLAYPTGTQAGDTVVVWQIHDNSSTMPPIATTNGVALTDSGLGGDANAPTVRLCWRENLTAAQVTAGLAGASGTKQVYCAVFRKAGGFPTIPALATYNKTAATSTTTITWPAITITQDCILAGLAIFLAADDASPALRSELTVVGSRTASASKSYLGVSDVLDHPADTIGAATTTKVGTAGRVVSSQVVIY